LTDKFIVLIYFKQTHFMLIFASSIVLFFLKLSLNKIK